MKRIDGITAQTDAAAGLLREYSVEITSRDMDSIDAAASLLPQGAEVFVANLPKDTTDTLVKAARRLRNSGFEPVPHMVARNISGPDELHDLMARLSGEAGVSTVLALGGDRDGAAGSYDAALQLIQSGAFEKNGVKRIRIACYPEGHPRIPDSVLARAVGEKLTAAREAGLEPTLVSQFLFEPDAVVRYARALRALGIEAPLRVGLAGPAERTKLIKYALRCGVGASLRVLRNRTDIASKVMTGETPDAMLESLAAANVTEPGLGISGFHFFTFGDPAASIRWAEKRRRDTGAED